VADRAAHPDDGEPRRGSALRALRAAGEACPADLQSQVDACVQLLEDLKIRADFINKLRSFYEMLGLLEHRPEVPGDVFRDAKLLGFINKVAANLYRDPALNLFGVAEKVKSLINAHVSARGVDPKIPPTAITDAEFEKVLQAQGSSRARAAQMQHAARYHIIGFSNQNPAYARKMSERLEEILQRFKDDWNALERELKKFIDELRQGDRNDFPNLVEGHHGPEFWQALGRAMPDWQKRKDALADKAKDYLVFGLPSGRAGT
jgi:type I restriction enzyme, R subunit